jgi:hypothetical protein
MDDSSRTANDLAVFRAFEVTRYTRPLPARDRRQLRRTAAYTDDEEVLFQPARPILLNGIEEVVSRPDLGDRAIFLTLAPIGEAQRRPESELWREFEIARPCILGALLDAVVHGLRAMGCVHLDPLPRMADFALWATACETALWPAGTFASATRQTAERPSKASSKQIP